MPPSTPAPLRPRRRQQQKPDPKQRIIAYKRQLIEFLKSIAFALIAVIILNSFVLASFQVPTPSMEGTVMAGDMLFVNKYIFGGTTPPTIPILGLLIKKEIEIPYFRIPGFRDPARGDVIVFIFPGYLREVKASQFQYFLKRCVAVAHDTLRYVDKKLYVNGALVERPRHGASLTPTVYPAGFVETVLFPETTEWNRDQYGPLVVPAEGDVIPLTMENLHQWKMFIQREGHEVSVAGTSILIDGKPASSYRVQRDYVFGMGDNRDNSADSRYWGFIPKEYVIGTPIIVYWSWDPDLNLFGDFVRKLKSIRFNRIGTLID
jgi:signal peptidase I